MHRENRTEILDRADVPGPIAARAYRDLARIHHWLGDIRFLVRELERDPLPVRRVLDVGCAGGEVLQAVQRRLGVEGIGVDLNPPATGRIPIIRADAVRDKLPAADVAFCLYLGHHLSEADLASLIRNVGRSCRRLILLDLVRRRLPLWLFRVFVSPFVSPVVVADGITSIRRAYTPPELREIAENAIQGTGAALRHSVTPIGSRQVIDIAYAR